jgi:multiple sugar transport system ATP-binding protein
MNEGHIPQFDKPTTVYSNPSDTFVAGFIGSPSMNFFEGQIIKKKEAYFFENEQLSLPIPKNLEKEIQIGLDKEIVLGIRPEEIVDHEKAIRKNYTDNKTTAKIEFAELLGSRTYIHAQIKGCQFLATVDPRYEVKLGASIDLGFNLKHLHLFDKTTKKALI